MAKREQSKSKSEAGGRQQKLPLMWDDVDDAASAEPEEGSADEGDRPVADSSSEATPADEPPEISGDDVESAVEPVQTDAGTVDRRPSDNSAPADLPDVADSSGADKADMIPNDSAAEPAVEEAAGPKTGDFGTAPAGFADSSDRAEEVQDAPAAEPVAGQQEGAASARRGAGSAAAAVGSADGEDGTAAGAADDGESAGDMLMATRADLGLSVEDVSAKTRIPRKIIENLECNAFEQLPAEFYCQAHIERLCDLYNVDSEPVVERFHRDAAALRGDEPVLDHVTMARHESESGAIIRPMPEGSHGLGGGERSLSVTGILVSIIITVFLAASLYALVALHLRNRESAGGEAAGLTGEGEPPIELNEFIVPKQLKPYELPIPDDGAD